MTSQITLGNFFTIGGKQVLGGAGGSGLDTQSIINALVTAKGQAATNDQTQITANGKITSALQQFQSLLSTFQSAASALRNPPGVGNEANNVFAFTTANVGNGGSSYVSVTSQAGAALQTYNISNISSLATAASQSSGTFTVANTGASVVSANPISGSQYQFAPGTITFSDGQTLTLNEGDSLTTVANDFNSVSSITGISATIVQISNNQYQLSFNATQTGSVNGFNLANGTTITSDPSGVLSNIGLTEQQTTSVFNISDPSAEVASGSPIGGLGIQFTPGVYTINGQSVTITEGDSLTQVAADFNTVPGLGITAHILQTGTNAYELAFTQNPGSGGFNLGNIFSGLDVGTSTASTTQQSTGTFTIANPNVVVAANADITGTTGIQFTPGTYVINGKNVVITDGQTLAQVANDFNSVSGLGVSATVQQTGSSGYQLVLKQTSGAGNFDLSGIVTGVGLAATTGGSTVTAGTDANFTINGIAVTRSSNSIDDVINGLTFNLLATTPDSTTNYPVTISPDTTTIQNSIISFVNSYNALQTFATQQTQLNSDGTYTSTAVLATNQTFRQTMADVTQEITSQVAGLSGSVTSLADIGITFTTQPATSTAPQVSNILTADDGALSSALDANFQAVDNLFGFNLTSNNPNLTIFSATNSLSANSITINANPGTNIFTATVGGGAPITLTATAIPNGGYTLTGPAGSALDGLQLIYASNDSATINVSITQGVADRAYNTSNAATTANTGTIAVALTGIQTQNTTLNTDITRVNSQVSSYQQQLLKQFASLESAISSTNNLLSSLAANDAAKLESANIS